MSEEQQPDQPPVVSKIGEHRLIVLVAGSILIAVMLVVIGLAMYHNSPAAQIDLSRPGYKSIQTKAEQYEDFKEFSASGPVDRATLDEFKKLYEKQALESTDFDAFGSDALSDQTLHIDNPTSLSGESAQ